MFNLRKKTISFSLALLAGSCLYGQANTIPRGFSVQGAKIHSAAGKIVIPKGYKAVVPGKLAKMPELTSSQKAAGYVVFKKHYMDKVYPYTVPKAYELTNTIRCLASPGEYEPMTFAVRTLKKSIKDFTVSVSDLKATDKEVIPSKNIEIRLAEYIPFKDLKQKNTCHMEPEVLERAESKNLKPESSYWYWLTLYVPKGQEPGTYKGSATLSAKNSLSMQIEILVKVFPVELTDPPTERYMHIGGHETNLKLREQYYIDMKEHGMNTVAPCNFSVFCCYRNGKIKLNFGRLDEEISLYRKVGFNKPLPVDMRPVQAWLICLEKKINQYKATGKPVPQTIPVKVSSYDLSPSGSDFEKREYKKIVNQIIQHARNHNYPKLYFLPQEESTNKGTRLQQLTTFSALLKECGVTTTSWSNGSWAGIDELQDNDNTIDIRYYNYVTPETRERAKKSGDFFGIFNHGKRLMYGFVGRKVKAEGMGQWAYAWRGTKGLFGKGTMTYGDRLTYPGAEGPLPSPAWEYVREGVDDAKYIYTLECLINSQLKSENLELRAQAQKAQKDLEGIFNQLPSSTKELNNMVLAPETLDIWRFKIIRMIMALSKNQNYLNADTTKVKENNDNPGFVEGVYSEEKNKQTTKERSNSAVSLVIPYTDKPPVLDGVMNDPVWKHAAKTRPFVLLHRQAQVKARAVAATNIGRVGEVEAGQKTVAYLCYDDKNLYLAFNCSESQMNKIVAACDKRDGAVWSDDSIEIFIVPDADMKRCYQMALNSNAVVSDIEWLIKKGKKVKGPEWNPNWSLKTRKLSDRWIAEIKIPFAALGLKNAPAPGSSWKMNLAREEQPSGGEYSSWPHLESSFHELHNYGSVFFGKIPVVNISNIETGRIFYGTNSLILDLKKNISSTVKVNIVLAINQKGKISSFHKTFDLKNPLQKCTMDYKISSLDDVDMTAKVYSEKSGALISQAVMKSNIPPVLSFKCVQKEVYSGTKTCRAELRINLSKAEIINIHGKIKLVANGNVLRSSEINNLTGGKSLVALNCSKLSTGNFQIVFSLKNNNGKVIAEKEDSFEIIENPY